MTIKTKYDIGDKVFALVEESDKGGFLLKEFKVNGIAAEECEEAENGFTLKARLEPIKGYGEETVFDQDIFQKEEDFIESMKELWKNRK
jgi:hypothetical protein